MNTPVEMNVVCLAGGVGGAKLAAGLAALLPPAKLTFIVNTGDDFFHLGLNICPDLDTVMYTLGGAANPETGWGRIGESWESITEVARLGGPDWFRLGDLDLATHLTRTHLLGEGMTLTAVTRHLCRHLDITHQILPMSDQPAATHIKTKAGILPFQTWFVKEKWQPVVENIIFPEDVRATPAVLKALENADIVILAPSNPFVSIDPILNVYPIRAMITDLPRAVVAVTPIIGGKAVKGPAAKLMAEKGLRVSAAAVAGYYGELIDGFVLDEQDASLESSLGIAHICVDTLMNSQDDRCRLAQDVLAFAAGLASQQ